jgi:ligand-binding sensor domain-containing protein
VEIDLATRKAVHHGPPAPALTGVFFDEGGVTWFSSTEGIARVDSGGEMRTFGADDGWPGAVAHGVGRGPDGAIWAATGQGLARFDGRVWRAAPLLADVDGDQVTARAVIRDARGRTWVPTAHGLMMMMPGARPAPATIVDGDVRDAAVDHFGRVWALGAGAITLVTAP